MKIFDENTAVKYINDELKKAGRPTYNDDELLNVIDMIWDFYDTRGLLDPDTDEDPQRSELENELASYALTMLRRDKNAKLDHSDLPLIITAELDYEDSLLDGDEGFDEVDDMLK